MFNFMRTSVSSNKKGFTLIELLVVIAIIGLLSTLAVIALGSARTKARDAKRLSDLKQVQTALELYYTDKAAYPTAADGITLGGATALCLDNTTAGWAATCTSPYMGLVPKDPGSTSYTYTSANGSTYTITATLEGDMGGLTAGGVQASPSGLKNS